MNPDLVDYGIQTEDSDIRAHVGVIAQMVFVFKTSAGLDALRTKKRSERLAWQPGVIGPTARGVPVPITDISDVRTRYFPSFPLWKEFSQALTTSEKGNLAVQVVISLMKRGGFPFWVDAEESLDVNIQRRGTDIIVAFNKRVQVKCDYAAGPTTIKGCTGNLFLQTAERNPLGAH